MLSTSLARRLLVLLTLAFPAALAAQFQDPTPDELKMTSDPKAPGEAAVYLNLEEVTNDPMHFHSLYARIKVLTEKGKELATVRIPYWQGEFKVTDIKGRTIHSDGTITALTVKPEDLLVAKSGEEQLNSRVFTLPSVEVGSIIEYRYELRYDDNHFSSPDWDVQRNYFIHKSHYEFTPFKSFLGGSAGQTSQYLVDSHGNPVHSLVWWEQLPPGHKMTHDAGGKFTLDLADIPAIPREDWMPPIEAFLLSVRFYYVSSNDAAGYWADEAKRWSKEVNHFAEPSKAIREAVAGIVAPTDSEIDKAKKLYKAVQALDNTDFTRKKSEAEMHKLGLKEARRAEDTWAQKSGSSEDITLLYLAMLRAAGINANAIKVVNRNRGVFTPSLMRFSQLDDDIIVAKLNGQDVYLDPGEKMCTFQMVSWIHAGASGLREGADGRTPVTVPFQTYLANAVKRSGDITIDEHGEATGNLRITMLGQEALHWRQMALRNDLEEVKKQYDESLRSSVPEGIEAHLDHFIGMDDPDVLLMAVVKISGTIGTGTGKRMFLPGFFFETRARHPFVDEEKRQMLVDMHYADNETDQVVYHLPAGFSIEGAPENAKDLWQDHAIFIAKFETAPNQVTVTRQLAHNFTLASPDEYKDLREFYQKIAAADQQQLVVTASAVAKGN